MNPLLNGSGLNNEHISRVVSALSEDICIHNLAHSQPTGKSLDPSRYLRSQIM